MLGLLVWACSAVYRRRLNANAALAGYDWHTALGAAIEAGKMVAELPRIWIGKRTRYQWVLPSAIDAYWQEAKQTDRGILILLPHLGCWEVMGHLLSDQCMKPEFGAHPLTAMYRPARKPWLDEIIRTSRATPSMRTVPADLGGVRQILKVLKAGQCTVVLPDQVPPNGMGLWSMWFGKPAYSMTLAAKLVKSTGALPLVCWAERLPWGQGYRAHAKALALDAALPLETLVAQINTAMEDAVRALPRQYLWSYARYKEPVQASV